MLAESELQLTPQEVVIGWIKDSIVEHKIDQEELSRVRRLVASGIRLADHSLTTGIAIREVIAQGIYLSSIYLGIPAPDRVGIIKTVDRRSGKDSQGVTVLAQSNKAPDLPNGYIDYSEPYLIWLANRIEGKRGSIDDVKYDPGYFLQATPHEMYHLFQLTDPGLRAQIIRDQAIAEGGGIENWNETVSEQHANRFGINFALAQERALLERNLASNLSF